VDDDLLVWNRGRRLRGGCIRGIRHRPLSLRFVRWLVPEV
jgi:hypothetical protein